LLSSSAALTLTRPHPEEPATSAFTHVFDVLMAGVSKDEGGSSFETGGAPPPQDEADRN